MDTAATVRTVVRWVRFVRDETDYPATHPDFPTEADASHSGLLKRMLAGEGPLPEAEYRELKQGGGL